MTSIRVIPSIRPIWLLNTPHHEYAPLKTIFNNLHPDLYLQKMRNELKPSRYRLFRRIKIRGDAIVLTDWDTIEQDVKDFRKEPRRFHLLPDGFILGEAFRKLLSRSLEYREFYHWEGEEEIDCNVHVVRQVARPGIVATNAPEGRHQDGAQFILSAFIVNLSNVKGGVSQVGTKEGFNFLETQLQPGQGLIHDDKEYHHDITTIGPVNEKQCAVRDLIGFDFNWKWRREENVESLPLLDSAPKAYASAV